MKTITFIILAFLFVSCTSNQVPINYHRFVNKSKVKRTYSYDKIVAKFSDTIKIKEKDIRKIYQLRTLSDDLVYKFGAVGVFNSISEIYFDKKTGLPLNGIYKIYRSPLLYNYLLFDSGVNFYDYRYPPTYASQYTDTDEQTKFPFLTWGGIYGRRQYNNFTVNDLLKFGLSDSFWQKDIIIGINESFFPENDTLFIHISELDSLSVYLTESEIRALDPSSYSSRMGATDMIRLNREKIEFKNREKDIVHKIINKSTGEFLNGLYHITISDNEYCIGLFYNGLPFNFNPNTLNVFEFYRDNSLYKKTIYRFCRNFLIFYSESSYGKKYEVSFDEPITTIKLYDLSHNGISYNGTIEVTEENKLQELSPCY